MAVQVDSNVVGWADQLARILDDFGFNSHADDGPMGESIVKAVAASISDRGYQQQEGFAGGWDENKREYRIEKVRRYGERRPNVRTRQMLSIESVEGERELSADAKGLTWRYGTGESPAGARTEHDRTTTDREKATWAHEGPSGNNDRPFFGTNADDEHLIREIAESALDRHLKSQ